MNPLLLAIAGPSGSGKTTLAQELARELEGTHFPLDNYYRDLSAMPPEERALVNFDDPRQIEHELLIEHLRALAANRPIDRPTYDFATHTRLLEKTVRIAEPHVLILDGLWVLHWPAVRTLARLCVYVDTPDAICLQRRLHRDVRERGRQAEQVRAHYAATVRPMAERYVLPSAQWADLVVDGAGSLDWSVEQVLAALRTRALIDNVGEEEPLGSS